MAPWYYYEMSLSQFVNFPQHAKVIVQVYEQDGVCDHRVGKEIFERLNLPSSEKDFVMLMREERPGYKLEADHGTPSGDGQDAHDFYGVYRLMDALADYAFTGKQDAKRIALGGGAPEQRFMGLWPDGRPVRELFAGDCVTVTRSSFSFVFPYSPTTIGVMNVSSASFKVEVGLAPDSLASALGTNATTVVSSPNPSLAGDLVNFSASVLITSKSSAASLSANTLEALRPTGTVTFFDGSTQLATVPLQPGAWATFNTPDLAVGSHSITVKYNGDNSFAPSTSAVLTQTVNQATTATTVVSSPNPSLAGELINFSASVLITSRSAAASLSANT
ncbi:MAG: Ig-like domain-containing protein, partial [Chloroflexi bacterium]|nr:Ig-like domain-containing protein [Chloroflexota bacterium]